MGRALGVPKLAANRLKRGCVIGGAIHVAEEPAQFGESVGIQAAMLLETVFRSRLELIKVPARLSHPKYGHLKMSAFQHRLKRREDFFVSQVAGSSEKNQRVCVR